MTATTPGATPAPAPGATGAVPASGSRTGRASAGPLPRAGVRPAGSGAAPLRNNYGALLQVVLFWAGAILLPLGLVVIVLGYYGSAHTPYLYDQVSYLVSGGMLGLGLTFCGGFLYFGAWLARIAEDGRESNKRLSDTLLLLADVTSRAAAVNDRGLDTSALPVIAGEGTTIHRRDCPLVAQRDDLRPLGADAGARGDLTACRVCKP